MSTSLDPVSLAARRLAAGALLVVAGCAGDDLLLPDDGTPAQLRAVSGDRQSAPAGDPVQNPLVVEALDRADRPVPGAVIVFEFVDPPTGAVIAPASRATDPDGRASVEVTLGTPAGDQDVEARLDDPASDLKVQFDLTALQPRGGGRDEGGGDEGGGGGDDDDDDDDDEGDEDDDGSEEKGDKGKGKGKGHGKGNGGG